MRPFIFRTIVLIFIIFQSIDGRGQPGVFTSNSGVGTWNNAATWTLVSGTSTLNYPVAGDNAIITNGATISVSGSTCRNLLVDVNFANTITIGPFPFHSLTVNGTMIGWDSGFGSPNVPNLNISSINHPNYQELYELNGSNGEVVTVSFYYNNKGQIKTPTLMKSVPKEFGDEVINILVGMSKNIDPP